MRIENLFIIEKFILFSLSLKNKIINRCKLITKRFTFVSVITEEQPIYYMNRPINFKKIIQALAYFANLQNGVAMNKMKAYKMLCLADKYHIRQYGRSITNDNYYALPYGTVPSTTRDLLEGKITRPEFDEYIDSVDSNNYKSKSEANLKVFSKTDLDTLKLIYDKFNSKSQFELSEHSHLFPEWLRFKQKLDDPTQKNSYKIVVDDIFKNTDDGTGLFVDDEEFLSITKELFDNN